jgi:endonuclease/exonuclease/phosphatase family metal-dependent hydrolase
MNLRIMTYNIRGARGTDGKRDFSRIGKFLKTYQIDIALIQEMDTRPADRSTERDIADLQNDHFDFFVSAPTIVGAHGWYGNAILSRFPIVTKNVIDISRRGCEPRNILEVFMRTPAGHLHVVNTHKGLSPNERGPQLRSLHELLSRQSEVPLVVGGDINQWHTYSKALRALNESLHALTCGATFPTRYPFLHLDRMWCRPKGIVRTHGVLKTPETLRYSDHFPVVAEVDI